MLNWISEKLFSDDGDGNTQPTQLSPEMGAAGLLIEAAHRDGAYTEVERELTASALMKLFRLDNAAAKALCEKAEVAQNNATTMIGFAIAARDLDAAQKETLVSRLWELVGSDDDTSVSEAVLIRSVADVFGINPARVAALRPAETRGSSA